jgi:hypothetical protein
MTPLWTGVVVTLLASAAGGLWGGLATGTGGIVGGIEQGAALAGIGGLIVGLLSDNLREGAFAVAGVGLLTELGLGIGVGVAGYLAPKPASA